ncbi:MULTISPECIES: hypothetical protein [unclassified Endozoicomonas]|uniref:hypothetical protein n=1 Tax=unclassified Endozoicomonas TaxID=2644528 RepID=UPI0021495D77|nr:MULTISPECIES: hypothetical protein [unclassified Endozoicomonas]
MNQGVETLYQHLYVFRPDPDGSGSEYPLNRAMPIEFGDVYERSDSVQEPVGFKSGKGAIATGELR